ncbi:MAG: carboxypeptidase-like regulatory domain-containing protein [Gemmatimonadaceae bacterium]
MSVSAHAQAVRGVTITPDSALVPGVIVTLVDSTGTPVSRALADDGGQFTLRAPAAGTYRIEARRLAFRLTLDRPIVLEAGKILIHNVMLGAAPVQLAAFHVTADQQCAVHPDSGSAAFTVWEEARKALRASQLTRLTRAYKVDVTTFVRQQGPTQQRFRVTDSAHATALPIRPFTSPPAAELAERGYVSRDARGEVYHAPDEDVLLSESFAATHCLRILPDSGGGDNVRLAFAPVPGRRLPDISGVLTIDRASSELRRLDFSFTNLREINVVATPGGEIVFRRLPEASWLIEQWAIRLPVPEQHVAPVEIQAPARVVRGQSSIPVSTGDTRYGLKTTGGYVTRVTFGAETVWMRPAPGEP